MVSSDNDNYFDSDNGSVTDFDGSMSEGAYCVVSEDGSVADLDVDVWTMWIMVIRMFGPLRILVVAVRMLRWRTIVI